MTLRFTATLILAGLLALPVTSATPDPSTFRMDPRLELHLWASEPEVVDPVAIAFDAAGRAYVAECRDYPYGVGPKGQVGSSLRLLEDTDADGRADRSTLFATNLSFITAVTPWRSGVFVAAAPDLLFLKDTDGDRIADVREVVLTGFLLGVSDSLVNGLRFGPDGWIHGANGGNGGRLRSPKGGPVVELGDHDFALNPDTGSIRLTGRTGGGFGLVFDDWGRAFTTYNIDHIQHRYLDFEDLHGRTGLPARNTTVSISDHGEMAQIFPVSAPVTRPNHPEQSGHFSAAGGMGFLGIHGWPGDLSGSVFVCDVVGNLVHRDILRTHGAAIVASRSPTEKASEFLASTDPAFRPVGLEPGPDGALYLLDMQREVIEHPDYIPAKIREKQDIRAGADRGRIWRIVPKGKRPSPATPGALKDDDALVAALRHPDQWWRATAQRLIIERGGISLVPAIRRQIHDDKAARESPLGVVHALWTLNALGALERSDLEAGLRHPTAEVREASSRLVRLDDPVHAPLESLIRDLTRDSSGRVRFRAALALRHSREPASSEALAELLVRDPGDEWIRTAVLAAVADAGRPALLSRLLHPPTAAGVPAQALRETSECLAASTSVGESDLRRIVESIPKAQVHQARSSILHGFRVGLARRPEKPEWTADFLIWLGQLADGLNDEDAAVIGSIAQLGGGTLRMDSRFDRAWSVATNDSTGIADRVRAISLLAHADSPRRLIGLLAAREPEDVQTAALGALRDQRDPVIGRDLVAGWRTFGPEVRSGVLKLLLERRNFHEPLISALESGNLLVGELHLDLEQRRRLLRGGSPEISRRASRFVSDEEYSNRRKIVDQWLTGLPEAGDVARGRMLFRESCANCHRCGDLGVQVGPDLTGVAHRSVEDLLGNILDPNMAINPGFVAYQVETHDGETLSGLMSQGSADVITLIQPGGLRTILPRREVIRVSSSGASLMPEGLEVGRSPQDLRDLIAFIQQAR